jgi:hypothetical protein
LSAHALYKPVNTSFVVFLLLIFQGDGLVIYLYSAIINHLSLNGHIGIIKLVVNLKIVQNINKREVGIVLAYKSKNIIFHFNGFITHLKQDLAAVSRQLQSLVGIAAYGCTC